MVLFLQHYNARSHLGSRVQVGFVTSQCHIGQIPSANISLDSPSFMFAALEIAPCSHSQLSNSYKDLEQGMHDKKMTVHWRKGVDTKGYLNYKTKTKLKLKLPY